jgi:hypothetical protein
MKKKQTKNIAIFAFSFLAMIGSYNALMINSESNLSGSSHFKRLDEMFGVVTLGRAPAVNAKWSKITKTIKPVIEAKIVSATEVVTEEAVVGPQAAIEAMLDLRLVEVINPKKWENGVKPTEFRGSIATNNGIIESLSASLPEGLNVDIAFSEMTGNTFEYDLNGEVYTGMMYQVDQASYMITMTNGPLEGTRLKFAGEAVNAQATQNYLAETHNVEIGAFGEEMDAVLPEISEELSTQTAEAGSFNFNI